MVLEWKLKICFYLIYLSFNSYHTSSAYLRILSPLLPLIKADIGTRVELHCTISGNPSPRIFWLKDGHSLSHNLSWESPFEGQDVLISKSVHAKDSGNYTCHASNIYEVKKMSTELRIRTPPGKLQNVSVHPSTVVAIVRWHVEEDGGYPITNFTLLYRPYPANESESWHLPQPVHVSPAIRQFVIYQLKPGTAYTFRIWANNKLGSGEPVSICASTSKPMDPPEVFEKMLADAEKFGSTAWLVAVCMVTGTVLTLSLLSCALIYKEHRNDSVEEDMPRIIANPGFEIDLEQSYLLDHADFNDNTEQTVRMNNNTVIQPSRV